MKSRHYSSSYGNGGAFSSILQPGNYNIILIALFAIIGIVTVIYTFSYVSSNAPADIETPLKPDIKQVDRVITTDVTDIFTSAQTQFSNVVIENQWNMHCVGVGTERQSVGWAKCHEKGTAFSIGFLEPKDANDVPVMIKSTERNRCLEDKSGTLVLQPCDSSHNPQRWNMEDTTSGHVVFKNKASGKSLSFSDMEDKRWWSEVPAVHTTASPSESSTVLWKLIPGSVLMRDSNTISNDGVTGV